MKIKKMTLDLKEASIVTTALEHSMRKKIVNYLLKAHEPVNIRRLQRELKIKGYANFYRNIKILADAKLIDAVQDNNSTGRAITLSLDRKKFAIRLINAFKDSFRSVIPTYNDKLRENIVMALSREKEKGKKKYTAEEFESAISQITDLTLGFYLMYYADDFNITLELSTKGEQQATRASERYR